jgi:hypothetical protein
MINDNARKAKDFIKCQEAGCATLTKLRPGTYNMPGLRKLQETLCNRREIYELDG